MTEQKRHSEPLKNLPGHATYIGEPSDELRNAVNEMADLAASHIDQEEKVEDKSPLTIEEATKFFSDIYGGEHHIPGMKIHPWGNGFCVKDNRGDFATFDGTKLTRLVIMAHNKCYRAEISPISTSYLRVAIFKRFGREGSMYERHPTIEKAIENHNAYFEKDRTI